MRLNKHIYIFSVLVFLLSVVGSCKKSSIGPDQQKFFLKYYGGGVDQYSGNVELSADGGYVLVGSTNSQGNGGYDIYLTKLDKYGNQEWSHTYGGAGNDEGRAVRVAADGGYVIVGSIQDQVSGKFNMCLLKVNAEGNQQWIQEYGNSTFDEKGISLELTEDGGYILVGTTENVDVLKSGGSSPAFDLTDVYLLKVTSDGTPEWEDIYGFNSADEGTGIQQVSSDTYVSSGSSTGPAAIIQPDGTDMLVVKGRVQAGNIYDPNLYMQKSIPISEPSIVSSSAVKYLGNNTIIVLGTTNTSGGNIFLLKVDIGTGNKIWFRSYGGPEEEKAQGFSVTADGGFIVTGYRQTNTGNFKDIYLMKVNGSGDLEWENLFGGDGDDNGVSVKQTDDGGYVVSGNIAFGGSGLGANRVMSLIKTNSKGQIAAE